ncbi:patatin-like phospholipase family protein [Lentzea tibetensis]|uniref:Patatin-like phospholipase family protein n=1 Tax=Lentzea tibetensis TaxID=2591470 RepID=A0A563ELK8_9PSEU|nr:patatin-like phospholipase family protein [Lentzea tibetensis]TWP47922.1 patatin-like phospholipase family protein [Lentzea tibetensis]
MATKNGRALVLGGGGVVGVAWELGVLAALDEHGIDVTAADHVYGTSAGAAVGALLGSGLPVRELLTRQTTSQANGDTPSATAVAKMMTTWLRLSSEVADPRERIRQIGALALTAETKPEAQHRAEIAAHLPSQSWPRTPLTITAVDARTGELRLFDRQSGATLAEAVAASVAVPMVWPPITFDGNSYIDGGMRSATNADLAAGHARVLILAPMPDPELADQIALLSRTAQVETIVPNAASVAAFGTNPLDPAVRARAAQAGHDQGRAAAATIRDTWLGGSARS